MLVSKIRCPNPNKGEIKSIKIRNWNFINYIAMREGVDLTSVPQVQEYEKYYASENKDYLKYISDRPGSHGLFGNIDTTDLHKVNRQVSELTEQRKNIYRGIVSLKEDDAIRLGYDKKETWMDYMREVMPDVANEFGIPISKLQWVAAVHMEKGHPHCHYMFWRTDDAIKSPFIHSSVQTRCREKMSGVMFQADREIAKIAKTAERDLMVSLSKDILGEEIEQLLQESEGSLMGRVRFKHLSDVGTRLYQIADVLPDKGRLQYKLLPPAAKEQIDSLVNRVLEVPAIKTEYIKYTQSSEDISMTYSPSARHHGVNMQTADQDIRKRVANAILKSCEGIIRDEDYLSRYAEKAEEILPEDVREISYDSQNEGGITKEYIGNEFLTESAEEHMSELPDEPVSLRESDSNVTPNVVSNQKFQYKWSWQYKKALEYIYGPNEKDIPIATAILSREADKNNVLAFQELGKIYDAGIVPGMTEKQSAELSQQYYKSAQEGLLQLVSEEGKSSYEYKLGKLYEKGLGVEQDNKLAAGYYAASSVKGNKYAQYALGSMYIREEITEFTKENRAEVMKKGLEYLKESANQEFAYAAYTYAKVSEAESWSGISEKELDTYYKVAFDGFLEMLSEHRDDSLLYRVGTMYYDGKGTEADQEKAFECFRESAELNNPNAQYALGKTYADQESGYYDITQAIKYLQLSGKSENSYAFTGLGDIFSNQELKECNLIKAMEYYEAALKLGNENAAYKLGKLYSDPASGLYDINKAISYFEQAAEKGNSFALYKLGKIYGDQTLPQNEIKKAINYYQESAEQGNDNAQYALGKIYTDREGAHYNIELGMHYLNAAVANENIYAEAKIGNIYLWGKHEGIDKDEELGTQYLKSAAEKGNEYAQETLDFYEDHKNDFMISASYQCLRNIFTLLNSSRQQQETFEDLRRYKSRSKEQQKVDARKDERDYV